MAGGFNRRDDDALVPSSTNVLAALGRLKKTKNKMKAKKKNYEEASKEARERVFWAPAPLNAKSWADVEDDDNDDYYAATAAPPEHAWCQAGKPKAEEESESEASLEVGLFGFMYIGAVDMCNESESDDGLVEVGDEGREEIENEPEVAVDREPVTKMPIEAPPASKETKRQLSKKDLKKKGLEELEAVLAEFGYMNREKSSPEETQDDAQMQKPVDSNREADKKENAPGESKAMKKKKKDKSLKKPKEVQEQLGGTEVAVRADETTETKNFEDNSTIDMKERHKKLTSTKKKKSSKEMDSAARAAAAEAAARSAKLALAKKKEKNHYNRHPAR